MGIVMPGPKQGTKFDEQNIAEPGWLLESYQGKTGGNGARQIINDLDRRMFERAFMQWIKMGSGSGGGSFALARTTMDYFLLHLKQIQNNLILHLAASIGALPLHSQSNVGKVAAGGMSLYPVEPSWLARPTDDHTSLPRIGSTRRGCTHRC